MLPPTIELLLWLYPCLVHPASLSPVNSPVSSNAPSSRKFPWLPHVGFLSLSHQLPPDHIPLAMSAVVAEGMNVGERASATHHPAEAAVDSWEA